MLMSDVLGKSVLDGDGRKLGEVTDVRLVQDGPYIEGFGQALRVDALVVGRGGIAERLGYVRGGVRGPWALRVLASAMEGRAWLIPWTDLLMTEAGFAVARPLAHLVRLRDAYGTHTGP